jgi:NAD-dependent deacetylase
MESLERAAEVLDRARSVLFITGAGISADSGLPTYRGVAGLYEDKHTDDGVPIEVALSGGMFLRRPELCWKHIARIEEACRGARPNVAHHAIAALERERARVVVLTQNVDGLRRAAGTRSLIEIHGRVHVLYCTRCGARREVRDFAGLAIPPACAACGGLERPDVVLFDEYLPHGALRQLEDELERGFEAVFSVGTTSVFPYIAGPVLEARRRGIPTVEVNPGDSSVSSAVDVRLRMGAAAALGALAAAIGLQIEKNA